ncbi:MAG: regulatory protein [Arenicella sp.]|jgi:regulatory protein
MRIIKGKSAAKGKGPSAKKSGKGLEVDGLFYSAEEFIAEISRTSWDQSNTSKPSNMASESVRNSDAGPNKDSLSFEEAESFLLSKVSDEVSGNKSQDAGNRVKRGWRRSNTPENDLSINADSGPIERADQVKKEYKRLMAKGIRLLSMREHSVREISKKLSLKCESLDLVYAVVDELIANKYLSDRRFTETFVRSRQNRGFGPNKIKLELSEKGIEINIVDDYLDMNSAIWYESAEQQYLRKYGDGPVDDYKTWAKRARFMQGRGFSMEHIQLVVPAPTYK